MHNKRSASHDVDKTKGDKVLTHSAHKLGRSLKKGISIEVKNEKKVKATTKNNEKADNRIINES